MYLYTIHTQYSTYKLTYKNLITTFILRKYALLISPYFLNTPP
nr:hypothetical protein B11C_150018 [Bartonella sp. 1-1C]